MSDLSVSHVEGLDEEAPFEHHFAVLAEHPDGGHVIANIVVVHDENYDSAVEAGWVPVEREPDGPWIGWRSKNRGKMWEAPSESEEVE